MLRILEIAWLSIAVISSGIAVYQYFSDGWQAALWMLFVTGVSTVMYRIRRGQRRNAGQ